MTLKDLIEAVHQESKKQYPNMPEHALPKKKFSDKNANGLTQCILKFFELKGIKAWRQQSGGRFIREQRVTNVIGQSITTQKGRFIPQGKAGGKGAGDISAIISGKFVSIEVKIGKDRQSEDQKTFQKELENSGGVYFVTKTWNDFYFQISKLLEGQQIKLL